MRVKDIMIPVAESIEPATSLRDAAERMKALDIDPMPVCESGKLVGLLSGGAVQDAASRAGLAAGSQRVLDVMSTDLVCCSEEQPVVDALAHVLETAGADARGRFPVTDASGDLAGIVSIVDLKQHAMDDVPGGTTAVSDVESVSDLVDYGDDRLDFMNDESFPASDPLPPPTSLTRAPEEDR